MARKRVKGPWWRASEGRWYATIGGKKVRFPATIGERDEPAAWAHYQGALDGGRMRAEAARDPTVSAVMQLYLAHLDEESKAGRITVEHYRCRRGHLGHFVAFDGIGARPARTLEPRDVTRFAESMKAEGYSASWIVNAAGGVQGAFNWASRPGCRAGGGLLIASNPTRGAKVDPVGHSPERFAERSTAAAWLAFLRRRCHGRNYAHKNSRKGEGESAQRFRHTANGRGNRNFALLQRVLIRTGARPGELARAEWADVAWDAGRTSDGHPFAKIVLPWQRWKNGKKTRRERVIYLPPALTRAIRREHQSPDRHPTHVFFRRGGDWGNGAGLAVRVRHLRPSAARECNAIAAKAGRPAPIAEAGPGRIVNYLWRHTAASTLLMMGVDLPRIAEALGTSAKMIEKVYGHLLTDYVAEAAEVLARGRKVPPRPSPPASTSGGATGPG